MKEEAALVCIKETTFQRADFALQLLMFVTAGKGEINVYNIHYLLFLSAVVPATFSKDRLSSSRP